MCSSSFLRTHYLERNNNLAKHCRSQVKLPEIIGKARYHLDKTRGLDLCRPSPPNQISQKAESNQPELRSVPKLRTHHHTLSLLSVPFPQQGSWLRNYLTKHWMPSHKHVRGHWSFGCSFRDLGTDQRIVFPILTIWSTPAPGQGEERNWNSSRIKDKAVFLEIPPFPANRSRTFLNTYVADLPSAATTNRTLFALKLCDPCTTAQSSVKPC